MYQWHLSPTPKDLMMLQHEHTRLKKKRPWRWGSWWSPKWNIWKSLLNEWRNTQSLSQPHIAILPHILYQTPFWCGLRWICSQRRHADPELEKHKPWLGSASSPAYPCPQSEPSPPTSSRVTFPRRFFVWGCCSCRFSFLPISFSEPRRRTMKISLSFFFKGRWDSILCRIKWIFMALGEELA